MALMPKITEPAKIGDNLEVDVIIDREANFDSEVTENPVETGFVIADHVNRKPMTLKMQVVFTPTPVTHLQHFGGSDPFRLTKVANEIMQIYTKGDPITITTPDAIYDNMVMTRAPLPRNVQNGFCYKMDLEFKHVVIVTQRMEDIPEAYTANDAQGKAGTTEKDGGTAQQKEIGTGMTTVLNLDGIPVSDGKFNVKDLLADTMLSDFSVAGDIFTGKEITANTAAKDILSSLTGGG